MAMSVLCLPVLADDLPDRAAAPPPLRADIAAPCALPGGLTSAEPAAEEREFMVQGQVLRAIVTRPAGAEAQGVAVLLHGYQGSRDEFPVASGEGLFVRTAGAMARAGIASVRFDFRGSGVSDGAWAETTFAGQTEDALAVIGALPEAELHGPVHLLGFSQGGLIALQSAAAQDGMASVTLWNPVLDPFQTYGRIFGDAALQAGIAAARDGALAAQVAGTGLSAAFFADIELSDPSSYAAAYAGPIFVVAGSQDPIAANGAQNAARLAELRTAPTQTLVVEAGHALGGSAGTATVDRAIACSIAFMLDHNAAAKPDVAPLQ